jgi:hypothetical protein
MGGTVMDFILGNNDASDPNFNFTGPFDQVAQRISIAITSGGAHRGSQGADACAATATSSATSSRSSSRAATTRRTGCGAPTRCRSDGLERPAATST